METIRWRALSLAAAMTLAFGAHAQHGDDQQFLVHPALLTVTPGTEVNWINKDDEPHTVMSADGGATFKLPALDDNERFSFTFSKPGTFKYFCSIHSHITGTIIVK